MLKEESKSLRGARHVIISNMGRDTLPPDMALPQIP